MASFNLNINGKEMQVDVDPSTPMLWVLREHLNLVGTKYGCGIAQCGACTVHVAGAPVRSCQTPVSAVGDYDVTTIEGNGATLGIGLVIFSMSRILLAVSKDGQAKVEVWKGGAVHGGAAYRTFHQRDVFVGGSVKYD